MEYVWKTWGFPFAFPHISLSQGECVWVFLLLSFILNLFCSCFVISLISLGDEHKVRIATLSMICFFFPFFCLILFLFFCLFLFIVKSWGSLTTLVLLLLFCLFYEEFSPKISHNVTYQILMIVKNNVNMTLSR